MGVETDPERCAEVRAVTGQVDGAGIKGAGTVGIGCAGVVEGPGAGVQVDFGLTQRGQAVGVVVDLDADNVARHDAADHEVRVPAGDVVGVGAGAVAAGRAGTGTVGIGNQIQCAGRCRQTQHGQVGQCVEGAVVARLVGDLGAYDVGVSAGHQRVCGHREVGVACTDLCPSQGDATEQRAAVVETQAVASHRVAGQRDAQVERSCCGSDAVVAAQATVAGRQQLHTCGGLGYLQVDDDFHGLAGRAGVAGIVKGHGPQDVRASTQADAGEAVDACAGIGDHFGDFFTSVEFAVVVEVVKQDHAGVDFGRAVEHQPRGGAGQVVAVARAHVHAGPQGQRGCFALVVDGDFQGGRCAFVASSVNPAHAESMQACCQAARGEAECADVQLVQAQGGDQLGLDAGEGAFECFHTKAIGRGRGGHSGDGGAARPGGIEGAAVEGMVAVAVGRTGGGGEQLTVDIQRQPDFDHLGLIEFAVVNAHEPAVGAAGFGCDHIGQQGARDAQAVERGPRQADVAHIGRVDTQRGGAAAQEGAAVKQFALRGVGRRVVNVEADRIGRHAAREGDGAGLAGDVVGVADAQVVTCQQVQPCRGGGAAGVDHGCERGGGFFALVAGHVQDGRREVVAAIGQRHGAGDGDVHRSGCDLGLREADRKEQGGAVVQAHLFPGLGIGRQRHAQGRGVVKADAVGGASARGGCRQGGVAGREQLDHAGLTRWCGLDGHGQGVGHLAHGQAGGGVVGIGADDVAAAAQAHADTECAGGGVGGRGRTQGFARRVQTIAIAVDEQLHRGTRGHHAVDGHGAQVGDAVVLAQAGFAGGSQLQLALLQLGREFGRVDGQLDHVGADADVASRVQCAGSDPVHACIECGSVVGETEGAVVARGCAADVGVAVVQVDAAHVGDDVAAGQGEAGGFGGDVVSAAAAGVVLRHQGHAGGRGRRGAVHRQPGQVAPGRRDGAGVARGVGDAGKNAPAADSPVVVAGQCCGAGQVDPAAREVQCIQTLEADLVGQGAVAVAVELDQVAFHHLGWQADAEGRTCAGDNGVTGVQAVVLARCQGHAQRLGGTGVDAHVERAAGQAGVAGLVHLQDAQAVVALGQRVGQGEGEGTIAAHGAVAALRRIGPIVDVEFFPGIEFAVAVAVVEDAQGGTGLALALDAQAVLDAGDAVTPGAGVAGGHKHERLGGVDHGVDGQGQGCGDHAAVAGAVHGHGRDLVGAVGQWRGGAGVGEGPVVGVTHAGAAQQHVVGVQPDRGDVLIGSHRAGQGEAIGAAQQVVGVVGVVVGVAAVVAIGHVGRGGCTGGDRVDRQALQYGGCTFQCAVAAQTQDAGLDGGGVGISRTRGAAGAREWGLGLQPQPATGQVVGSERDTVDFGVALQQTNHVAHLHGAGVESDLKERRQLLGDVVARAHARVGRGRDAHIAGCEWVGGYGRDQQVVDDAVHRSIAGQVDGLHAYLVRRGAGASRQCAGQAQAPGAGAGVQAHAGQGGVAHATQGDAAAGLIAVGLAVEIDIQAVGVVLVVTAAQHEWQIGIAGVLQHHGRTHRGGFVHHHRGGVAGGAPQAGFVLLDDAQVMRADAQVDVAEVVLAGTVCRHLPEQLQIVKDAVVVAVVVQAHRSRGVGETGEGNAKTGACHAVAVQAAGVACREQAGRPQLGWWVGVEGDHQRQRAAAHVAGFIGRCEGEHPGAGAVGCSGVVVGPAGVTEHLCITQRSVAIEQFNPACAGRHRAIECEALVDHRDAVAAAAAAVVHAGQQRRRRVGGGGRAGVGRDGVDLQAGQHLHAAHVARHVDDVGADEVAAGRGPGAVGHDLAALDVDVAAPTVHDVGGRQGPGAQHIGVVGIAHISGIGQPDHIAHLRILWQGDAEGGLAVGGQAVVAAQPRVRVGQQGDGVGRGRRLAVHRQGQRGRGQADVAFRVGGNRTQTVVARAQADGAAESASGGVRSHGAQEFAVVDQVVVVEVVKDADFHTRFGRAADAQTGDQFGEAVGVVDAAVVERVECQATGRRQFVIEDHTERGLEAGQTQHVDGLGFEQVAARGQRVAVVGEAECKWRFGVGVSLAQQGAVGVDLDLDGGFAGVARDGKARGAVGAVVGVDGAGVVFRHELEQGGGGNAAGADDQRAHLHIRAGVAGLVDQAHGQVAVGAVGQARSCGDRHVDGGAGQVAQAHALADQHRGAVHQQDLVAELHAFGQGQGQGRVGVAADGFPGIVEDFQAAHAAQLGIVGREGVVQIDPDGHRLAQQAGDTHAARREGLACPQGVQTGAHHHIGGKCACGVCGGAGRCCRDGGQCRQRVGGVGAEFFAGVHDAVVVDVVKNLDKCPRVGDAAHGQLGFVGDAVAADRAGVVGALEPELVAVVGIVFDAQEQWRRGHAFKPVGVNATRVDGVDPFGKRCAGVGVRPGAALCGGLHRTQQSGAGVDVDLAGCAPRVGARDGPASGLAADQVGVAGAGVVGRGEGDVRGCGHSRRHDVQAQVGLLVGHAAGVARRVEAARVKRERALAEHLGAADVDKAPHQVGGRQVGRPQQIGADDRGTVVELDAVTHLRAGRQLDAEGGLGVFEHAIGVEQTVVLTGREEDAQRGLRCPVDPDHQRIAGGADVACGIGLDDAQAVRALGQLVGIEVEVEGAIGAHPLVARGHVNGEFFAGVHDAVVVGVVKHPQAGAVGRAGVGSACDQENTVHRAQGDVVTLDA